MTYEIIVAIIAQSVLVIGSMFYLHLSIAQRLTKLETKMDDLPCKLYSFGDCPPLRKT